MGSICIGYVYFPFHDFQCAAILISLGRVSFSGERMATERLVYLSLELNGMSADSWCWAFCPLVFVSLPPWGFCVRKLSKTSFDLELLATLPVFFSSFWGGIIPSLV